MKQHCNQFLFQVTKSYFRLLNYVSDHPEKVQTSNTREFVPVEDAETDSECTDSSPENLTTENQSFINQMATKIQDLLKFSRDLLKFLPEITVHFSEKLTKYHLYHQYMQLLKNIDMEKLNSPYSIVLNDGWLQI